MHEYGKSQFYKPYCILNQIFKCENGYKKSRLQSVGHLVSASMCWYMALVLFNPFLRGYRNLEMIKENWVIPFLVYYIESDVNICQMGPWYVLLSLSIYILFQIKFYNKQVTLSIPVIILLLTRTCPYSEEWDRNKFFPADALFVELWQGRSSK